MIALQFDPKISERMEIAWTWSKNPEKMLRWGGEEFFSCRWDQRFLCANELISCETDKIARYDKAISWFRKL
jgi:hypothetical protein